MAITSSLSMSTNTSSALGTTHMNQTVGGLDVDALVSATIQAKSLPITLLQNKNAKLQAQMSDYNKIRTTLTNLQYAATDLTYSSAFKSKKATSTDEKVVTAIAKDGSSNGSYVINVDSTATVTSNTSAAIGTADSRIGAKAYVTGIGDLGDFGLATLNTQIGTTSLIKAGAFYINDSRIDVTSTDTINTIVNKITASGAGVTATVNASGNVTLTQKTAGSTQTIKIGTDTTDFFSKAGITQIGVQKGVDPDEKRSLKDLFTLDAAGVTKMSGYFSINGTFFSVDSEKDSIDSIIDKINSSTTAGVTAVYNPTTGTIALTSQTAGVKDIKLGNWAADGSGSDSSNFLSVVGLDHANQKDGKDAVVTVNGLAVTPVDNKVTFNNNTFTLVGKGTATVTVNDDIDAMVSNVQAFVDAYNAALDAVYAKFNEGEGKFDSSSDASVGDLFGDPSLSNINNALRGLASSVVTSQPAGYQQLSQIGITTGKAGVFDIDKVKKGHLEVDKTILTAALKSNSTAVASLFGNTTKSVSDEEVTLPNAPDGATKVFNLKNGSISGTHRVFVDSIEYTEVSGRAPKTYWDSGSGTTFDPDTMSKDHEYSLDYTTGKITFADAPKNTEKVKVSYEYDISPTSNASGLLVQLKSMLEGNTKHGGVFDTITGSNGSIQKELKYNNDRITDLQTRLKTQEATLYSKYRNMQNILSSLQSQGAYMTTLLNSMNSSNK